jgi:hypothetical protein
MQTGGYSDAFITTSFFFHGKNTSSSANLDVITDIVTGLPVSDHDHGTFIV